MTCRHGYAFCSWCNEEALLTAEVNRKNALEGKPAFFPSHLRGQPYEGIIAAGHQRGLEERRWQDDDEWKKY